MKSRVGIQNTLQSLFDNARQIRVIFFVNSSFLLKGRSIMKRVRRIVLIGLFLALNLGFSNFIYSENVLFNTDITTPQVFSGDLVLAHGKVNINSAGNLVVEGDLKINGGNIFMGPSAGELRVKGDLIITNTNPGGSASIIVHNNIIVTGEIIIKSTLSDAYISTTGATGDFPEYGRISAGSIITRAQGKAYVHARDYIIVIGEADTKSETDTAFVHSIESFIEAGRIVTNGFGNSYVIGPNSIVVSGELKTFSFNSDAYVLSDATIYSKTITTSAKNDAYVKVYDPFSTSVSIKVDGSINTRGIQGDAYVSVVGGAEDYGAMEVGSIMTHGSGDSYVLAAGSIDARGDIITKSDNSSAYVKTNNGGIVAVNVNTDAKNDAYVEGESRVNVLRDIFTYSQDGDAYVQSNGGRGANQDVRAYRMTTYSGGSFGGDAYISSQAGDVFAKGEIRTKSYNGRANIITYGSNKETMAESIFTHGALDSGITTSSVNVRDIIDLVSDSSDASILTAYDIIARSIKTTAGTNSDGSILSTNGDITVDGDIRTNAPNGDGFVKAPNGDIKARSIKTLANSGSDDSIQAQAGTGRFQLFLNTSDPDLAQTIKDCNFYLDDDHEFNTQLSLVGTCTINGNDHQLVFGPNGAIILTSGSSLMLKNINLDKIGGKAVRCADDTATLYLNNVTWTLTSDYLFDNGLMQIYGDFVVNGPSNNFIYTADQTSRINKDSTLLLTHGVTFSYDTDTDSRLEMVNGSSHFHFDGASLQSVGDIEFTKGTLVFDNATTFSVGSGNKIDFGDGVMANNIGLDFHLRSQFRIYGWLRYNNV